jgi:hypothetical protein
MTGVSGNVDGEMAASSGFVFYDDLLSPNLREPVGNDAGAHVGSATRRESDQQSHWTRWVDLRVCGARQRRKRGSPCRHMQKMSSRQLHDETPGAGHTRSTAKLSLFAWLRLVRQSTLEHWRGDPFHRPQIPDVIPADHGVLEGHQTNDRIANSQKTAPSSRPGGNTALLAGSSMYLTAWRSIPRGYSMSVIGPTTAFRFSIKTGSLSPNGSSLAGRAVCISTKTIQSRSPIYSPTTKPIRASIGTFRLEASRMAKSRPSFH